MINPKIIYISWSVHIYLSSLAKSDKHAGQTIRKSWALLCINAVMSLKGHSSVVNLQHRIGILWGSRLQTPAQVHQSYFGGRFCINQWPATPHSFTVVWGLGTNLCLLEQKSGIQSSISESIALIDSLREERIRFILHNAPPNFTARSTPNQFSLFNFSALPKLNYVDTFPVRHSS